MYLNYTAIFVASVLQFIFGAIWHTPLFGKTWGKIHGFDVKSKEAQDAMKKGMAPLLITQFITTVITTFVFALLLNGLPAEWNTYGLAGFFWLGFVVPTQIGAVIFGGTEGKWVIPKIAIMAGGSLGCLLIAAATLSLM